VNLSLSTQETHFAVGIPEQINIQQDMIINNAPNIHSPTTRDRATSAMVNTTEPPHCIPTAPDVVFPGAAADAEPLAFADWTGSPAASVGSAPASVVSSPPVSVGLVVAAVFVAAGVPLAPVAGGAPPGPEPAAERVILVTGVPKSSQSCTKSI
jgi:hypothetical protein